MTAKFFYYFFIIPSLYWKIADGMGLMFTTLRMIGQIHPISVCSIAKYVIVIVIDYEHVCMLNRAQFGCCIEREHICIHHFSVSTEIDMTCVENETKPTPTTDMQEGADWRKMSKENLLTTE